MALLNVCGVSDWMKGGGFNAKRASVDKVNHFNFAAQGQEFAVAVGVDVSGPNVGYRVPIPGQGRQPDNAISYCHNGHD